MCLSVKQRPELPTLRLTPTLSNMYMSPLQALITGIYQFDEHSSRDLQVLSYWCLTPSGNNTNSKKSS